MYRVSGTVDEDSAISVRTLALSRYKRNHELMEEVFQRAAFGMFPLGHISCLAQRLSSRLRCAKGRAAFGWFFTYADTRRH